MVDYKRGVQFSYSAEKGKIYQWRADQRFEGFGRTLVHALLNDGDLESAFPFHEVSEVRKSVTAVDGKSATEYSFQVQMKTDPSVGWVTNVRTDPDTGRIVFWEDLHFSGMQVTTNFDYPVEGPRDIYELGAPSDAEVVKLDELFEAY